MKAGLQGAVGKEPDAVASPARRGAVEGAAVAGLIRTTVFAPAFLPRQLEMIDELQARASHFASTLIYARDGSVLNEVGDPNFGRRTAVPLDQISPYLLDATIATEDPKSRPSRWNSYPGEGSSRPIASHDDARLPR